MEDTHRHETKITPLEWVQYQQVCKHFDIARDPRAQTAFLIRQFLKENADKITEEKFNITPLDVIQKEG